MWADMTKSYYINSLVSNRFQAGDKYGDKKTIMVIHPKQG